MEKAALEAVKSGTLTERDMDASVARILTLGFRAQARKKGGAFDVDMHHNLARRMSEADAVLPKNEGNALPDVPFCPCCDKDGKATRAELPAVYATKGTGGHGGGGPAWAGEGEACANLQTGKTNPSGKLTER